MAQKIPTEVQVAKQSARQAIIIAIIGAIVSLATIFKDVIIPKAQKTDLDNISQNIEEQVFNGIKGKVNETVKKEVTATLPQYVKQEVEANFGKVTDLQTNNVIPIGTILPFGGEYTSLDENIWMLCDGRELSIEKYEKLYKVIGKNWNPQNLSGSKFNIPNLKDMFLRGVGSEKLGVYESDAIGNHDHKMDASKNLGAFMKYDKASRGKPNVNVEEGQGKPDVGFNAVTKTTGLISPAKETRPKNKRVYYIIKVK